MNVDCLVTVIIPFYNRIKYTIDAVKSVQQQTYNNIEIILVNDKSECDISELIKYISCDARIKLVDNIRNKGASGARNTGIDYSNGDYIAFLDSDDLYHPQKIKKQVEFMYKSGCKMSHTIYQTFSAMDRSDLKLEDYSNKDILFPDVLSCCPIATPTVMLDRKVFNTTNFRFNENYDYGEDICLWIDIIKNFPSRVLKNESLTWVRKDGRNTIDTPHKLLRGIFNILHHISTEENLKLYPEHLKQLLLSCMFSVLLQEDNKKSIKRLKAIPYRFFLRPILKLLIDKNIVKNYFDKKYL